MLLGADLLAGRELRTDEMHSDWDIREGANRDLQADIEGVIHVVGDRVTVTLRVKFGKRDDEAIGAYGPLPGQVSLPLTHPLLEVASGAVSSTKSPRGSVHPPRKVW